MQATSFFKRNCPAVWSLLKTVRRNLLNLQSSRSVFEKIYQSNTWGDKQSRSGPGSNFENTQAIREFLPSFLGDVNARTLLDVPCGDLHWMASVDLGETHYIGGDIVAEIVERNRIVFAESDRAFEVMDIVKDRLPEADVLLCRDCFIHLPNRMVLAAFRNIATAPLRYVITTTYTEIENNIDIELGGFRHINLERAPFNLPKPMHTVRELEGNGKSMAVWPVRDLIARQ